MEPLFYYFDPFHPLLPFTAALPGDVPEGGDKPDNALLVAPRLDAHGQPLPGEWPVASVDLSGWDYVEDHRQRKDERGRVMEGTGTPYWLAAPHGEDDWQTPARYVSDIGPLPEGALLTQPVKTQEDLAVDLRMQRDARIAATDYLMAVDYPLTEEQRAAWAAYRQALRDMPGMEGFPWDGGDEETPWPVRPE